MNYDVICVENLNADGMTDRKSTAYRRKVNNKSKADRAYGEFCRMLTYKSELYGKELIKVDRFFPSSQLCSDCGLSESVTERLVRYRMDLP